jgi:hypothetical protein
MAENKIQRTNPTVAMSEVGDAEDTKISTHKSEGSMNGIKIGSAVKAVLVAVAMLAAAAVAFVSAPSADAATGTSVLWPGEQLYAGQSLVSGNYTLAMQGDGNFVLYAGNQAKWQSGTSGHPYAWVTMQGDGNLVVYSPGPTNVHALWQSGTYNNPGARLTMQSDGNAVIYNSVWSRALWATNTSSPYPYWITATKLCNHVFRMDSPTRLWDPKLGVEVATSYTFGYTDLQGGHCVYEVTDQIGVDINTLDVIQLQNHYDFGWHWDVLAAAGAGAGACNPPGLVWFPELLPYRAVMTSWCGAVGAAGYVLN